MYPRCVLKAEGFETFGMGQEPQGKLYPTMGSAQQTIIIFFLFRHVKDSILILVSPKKLKVRDWLVQDDSSSSVVCLKNSSSTLVSPK